MKSRKKNKRKPTKRARVKALHPEIYPGIWRPPHEDLVHDDANSRRPTRPLNWPTSNYIVVNTNAPNSPDPQKLLPIPPQGKRKAILEPILKKKGFSTSGWATEAGVDFHTANDYLNGETKPNRESRRKLAAALDIEVGKLPE